MDREKSPTNELMEKETVRLSTGTKQHFLFSILWLFVSSPMTMSPGVGVPEIEPCDTAASLQPDTPENFDCGITSRRWPLWPPHDGKSTKSARKDGEKKAFLEASVRFNLYPFK